MKNSHNFPIFAKFAIVYSIRQARDLNRSSIMKTKKTIIICIISICKLFLGEIQAQPKSFGPSFCYAGVGLVYEHCIDDRSFAEIQLRTETAGMYAKRENGAGLSASFTWNMIFAEMEARDGNSINFFAGPGVMAGVTGDIVNRRGLMLGLKGRIGGECSFRRNVTVSLSISPVIGLHLGVREGMLSMLPYRTGVLYSIMPEVGIKYAF